MGTINRLSISFLFKEVHHKEIHAKASILLSMVSARIFSKVIDI
ncbi:hypothetical protein RV10_GL003807 [Enterococcus pallens]|nr:hypothetical protein RV10_GL003807 [Enterococcus pallens]